LAGGAAKVPSPQEDATAVAESAAVAKDNVPRSTSNEASPQTDEHATLQANQSTSPAAPMHANASYLRHHQPAYSAAFRLPESGSEPDKATAALGNAASQPPSLLAGDGD
jgi:hypothetical protein